MALILSAAAVYNTGGDLVAVDVWLEDPATGVFKPQEIASGTAELLLATEDVPLASIGFDRLNGTADGAVHVTFLHPPVIRDLKARAVVDTFNDGTFRAEVPVAIAVDTTPLAAQPGSR